MGLNNHIAHNRSDRRVAQRILYQKGVQPAYRKVRRTKLCATSSDGIALLQSVYFCSLHELVNARQNLYSDYGKAEVSMVFRLAWWIEDGSTFLTIDLVDGELKTYGYNKKALNVPLYMSGSSFLFGHFPSTLENATSKKIIFVPHFLYLWLQQILEKKGFCGVGKIRLDDVIVEFDENDQRLQRSYYTSIWSARAIEFLVIFIDALVFKKRPGVIKSLLRTRHRQ